MEQPPNPRPKYVSIRTNGEVRLVYAPTETRHPTKDLMLEVVEIIRQAGIEYMAYKESQRRDNNKQSENPQQ